MNAYGECSYEATVLTPIQKQLHEQLREKSQKLQQAILKQQEELQQITQQLAMAQQGMPPLPDTSIPNPGKGCRVQCCGEKVFIEISYNFSITDFFKIWNK